MPTNKKIKDLDYEEAFNELQNIVSALEEQDHTLDKSMELYERGQALLEYCSELLEKAELKIQALSADGDLSEFDE